MLTHFPRIADANPNCRRAYGGRNSDSGPLFRRKPRFSHRRRAPSHPLGPAGCGFHSPTPFARKPRMVGPNECLERACASENTIRRPPRGVKSGISLFTPPPKHPLGPAWCGFNPNTCFWVKPRHPACNRDAAASRGTPFAFGRQPPTPPKRDLGPPRAPVASVGRKKARKPWRRTFRDNAAPGRT